jgi:hypothetical protein
MQPIIVRYHFTKAEAVKASMEIVRRSVPYFGWTRWIGVVMLSAGLSAAFLAEGDLSTLIPVVIVSAFLILAPVLMRLAAGAQFKSMPLADKEVIWEIDEDRLRNRGEGFDATLEWKILYEVTEIHDGFLLFIQKRLAHWLPKAAFASQEDIAALGSLIRSSGVRHNGLPGAVSSK